MIYKSLHTLPMIICEQILKTGDVTLLSDEPHPVGELAELWEKLEEELKAIADPQGQNKVFSVSRECEFLANKYDLIHFACAGLRFEKNADLIQILVGHGYSITDDNYIKNIEKAERESKGIVNRIKQLQSTLPKEPGDGSESSIVDVMAGYSVILGFDFDFNTVSVMKFYSLEKQVKSKMKAMEQQSKKNKK